MCSKPSILGMLAALTLFALPAFAQLWPGGMDDMLDKADMNRDGNVSRAEFINARAQQFSPLDRNGDDFIDESDAPPLFAQRMRDGVGNLLAQFDTNGDAKVSKEEFVDGPTPVFDRADADGNHLLDTDEVEAARTQMKAQAASVRKRA